MGWILLGALAHLHLGRVFAGSGNKAKAKAAYEGFPRNMEECRRRSPSSEGCQSRVRQALPADATAIFCLPIPCDACLLNRDLHWNFSNPGRTDLNAGLSYCHVLRHSKVHLVTVHRAGVADRAQYLGRFSVYYHLDG